MQKMVQESDVGALMRECSGESAVKTFVELRVSEYVLAYSVCRQRSTFRPPTSSTSTRHEPEPLIAFCFNS